MAGGGLSGNKSKSGSSFSEDVWSPQGGALEDLYGSAADLFGSGGMFSGILNNLAGSLTPYMQNVMGSAQGGMDKLIGGGSVGDTSEIRNELMDSIRSTSGGSNMGRMYDSIVGGSGNTYIDPMVDAMKSGYQENLDRNLASGALDAAAMGQGGSSRHAMSDAMLKRDALQDMSNQEMMMRGGAYDKDLQMKMDIARQADQGIQQSQQNLLDMLGMADRSTSAGVGMGQGVQGLGMGAMAPWMQAMQAPWYGMNQYANIIGAPTVLGSGSSNSSSKGAGASGYVGI